MSSNPADDRPRSSSDAGTADDTEIRADRVMHPDRHPDATETSGTTDTTDRTTDRTDDRTGTDRDGDGIDDRTEVIDRTDDRNADRNDDRTEVIDRTDDRDDRDDDRTQVIDRTDDRDEHEHDRDRDRSGIAAPVAGAAAGAGAGAAASRTGRDDHGHGHDQGDDLDRTQAMPRYDDDTRTDARSDEGGRVSRDEYYRRNPDEADRVAALRADHEASRTPSEASTDHDTAPAAGAAGGAAAASSGKRRKIKPPRTTDKFFGAFGLFVLRVVTGVIFGVHGAQKLLAMEGTAQFFSTLTIFGYPLPQPQILALVTGAAEVLIGIALVFGFVTRLCGFGVLLISVGALLMVKMTTLPNPFASTEPGFQGELELILAAVGLLLLVVGGGGWALDRLFRRGRYGNPDEQLSA